MDKSSIIYTEHYLIIKCKSFYPYQNVYIYIYIYIYSLIWIKTLSLILSTI